LYIQSPVYTGCGAVWFGSHQTTGTDRATIGNATTGMDRATIGAPDHRHGSHHRQARLAPAPPAHQTTGTDRTRPPARLPVMMLARQTTGTDRTLVLSLFARNANLVANHSQLGPMLPASSFCYWSVAFATCQ